jgi:predicted transcriptional regulator
MRSSTVREMEPEPDAIVSDAETATDEELDAASAMRYATIEADIEAVTIGLRALIAYVEDRVKDHLRDG